jgi:hypothetical protein
MGFSQTGTTAVPFENNHNIDILKDFNFTSTEGHDLNTTFQKAQDILDQLEQNHSGTIQDLELLSKLIDWLPRNSEERLECDIRIRSIKKKWGIDFQTFRQKKQTEKVKLAFTVNNIEQIMIEIGHADFINSGKDARVWIIEQLSKASVKEYTSEEEIVLDVEEKLRLLEELLSEVKSTEKGDEVFNAFQILQVKSFITADQEIQESIISQWMLSARDQINTLTQLNIMITKFYDQTINESQSPISSTLNEDQLTKFEFDRK